MSTHRDRMIAVGAAFTIVLLAATVMFAVISAERNGRKALEELQLAQLDQLARLLDSAFAPALASPVGAVNPATSKPWSMAPGDPGDAAGLALLQSRNPPDTRTGYVLVDKASVVVNGTLLVDRQVIGKAYSRTGLEGTLQGKGALLPVDRHSLTTPLPTIAVAIPVTAGKGGAANGVLLQESDVAPESAFTKIMAGFRRAKTDQYSFLDSAGVVIASTDPSIVGKLASASLRDPVSGFHREGDTVTATADIKSVGWRAAYSQSTHEFEGKVTGPLRTALLFLMGIAMFGAGLVFFTLLARLRAARVEQQRLASINEAREEFVSIVSHELRTPATGQLGFLQTLLDHWDGMDDAERRDTVGQAFTNARRLHALTRDVLDTTSIEAGELPYAFEVLDLGPAIQDAVSAVPEQGDEVSVDRPAGPLTVRADPERIQQVLINLLDNAIKNSPTGSRIDVHLARTDDGQALVEVSDRGAGISEDETERAFEKFTRGRHTGPRGTGLGLYICRKIIDAHGGRIWARSRDGGGATLAFTLPMVDEPIAPSTPAAPTGAVMVSRSTRG
jgi:signal transduction histidine kinase